MPQLLPAGGLLLCQTLLLLQLQLQLLLLLLAKAFGSLRSLAGALGHVSCKHNLGGVSLSCNVSRIRHTMQVTRHTLRITCALSIFSVDDACCSRPCPSASSA